MAGSGPLVSFGEFEMDLASGEVWRRTRGELREPVHLPPLAARLLVLLVSRPGRLVDRQEIRAELWGDRFVDWEAGLHQTVRRVRTALGDDREPRRFVETVARRGYRFAAAVLPVRGETPVPRRHPLLTRRLGALLVATFLLAAVSLAPALWVVASFDWLRGGGAAGAAVETAPAEARRLYREALHLASRFEGRAALQRLQAAAEQAPRWSAPWSAIAELWLVSAETDRVAEARRAIERSLARDPRDARAWRALARLRLWEEWDWVGARGALERAITIEPGDADGWQLLAALETVTGRETPALFAAYRAVELDPVSTVRSADLGWTLYYFERLDEAAAECERGLVVDPESTSAAQCLLRVQLLAARHRGEPAEGLVVDLRKSLEGGGDQAMCATAAATALPRYLYGDLAGAIEALLQGAREGHGWELPFAMVDPLLEPLAADPRLTEIEEALGFPVMPASGIGAPG